MKGATCSITRPHKFPRVWSDIGDNMPVCYFETVVHVEGWGWMPINGSGPRIRGEIAEAKNRPVMLCTESEHLEFLREYFPTTHEYEMEQRALSLNSSSL